MNRLTVLHRRVRRTLLARRRLLAALAATVAVAAGLQATAEPSPPTSLVLTAARDIPGGTVVRATDLAAVAFAPASVPEGVLDSAADAVGRTTATPVRAGEPITDVRLVSGSMLSAYPGRVAAPVRIGDAGAVGLLRVGDRVDVLAADPQGGSAEAAVVAADAPVIAVPGRGDQAAIAGAGALVVLAVSDKTAQTIAAAGVSRYLSIVIRH
ncbi:MAG TPA: Flp pilus assembly protein CpaB [Nocardioidaceae bacterium]|nr:Flp pilus assembly protein CpaB [Nocardioidaceae bacterium]